LSLKKQYAESARVLDQFWPYREDLHDPGMAKLLRETIDNNREKLGSPTAPQWDDWLKEVFATSGTNG
jgi:hypothetical protein